jgi:anti-sigma factor RsiW
VNCNKVSHLLSAFMDGELLGHEHRLIHHHLQRCPKCQTEYEELLQMKRLLAAMRLREPHLRLAASISQQVSEREFEGSFKTGTWRDAIPALTGRPHVYSPILGLGVGLTFFGILFWAHPTSSATQAVSNHRAIQFEPADVARDEPPPHVSELTSGLMRESAPRPVSFEPRYSDNLPDFPFGAHQPLHARKSFQTTSLFR